jgi:transposase, IS30 family
MPAAVICPVVAERIATERLRRPRDRRLAADTALRETVCQLLAKRWSPEQVAQEPCIVFPGQGDKQLCAESSYQAIYDPDLAVTRPAKRRRRRRRRTVQGIHRRGRLRAMTMIDQRPSEVEDRAQIGHWERACIMGAGRRTAIGTLVERRTRYLNVIHIPAGRPTGEVMRDSVTAASGSLPAELCRTLTWDQGKEMALHQQISEHTGITVFLLPCALAVAAPHQREHERALA